ncbi:MAG: ATP-binding protein [Ginsengibacter sp.]
MDKLIQEQEKFKAIFQNASLGILVINESGFITLANDFLISEFGYDGPDELFGKKMEILIPARFRHQHVNDRDQYAAHPSTRPMGIGRDLYGITKDGTEIPVEVSLSNYTDEKGTFSIAFISNISPRIKAQSILRHQRLQLAAMNKEMETLNEELEKKVAARTAIMQETLKKLEFSKEELSKALSKEKDLGDMKSAFVSMASHEFRTPLSTILSSASLLAKYKLTSEQEKRDKHIQRIKSSVLNLNNILNEFLSLGKIEDGKVTSHKSNFAINKFITQLINEISEIFKPGQEVNYTHKGDPEIFLDEGMFRNILINLLSNAAKFSDENNIILVNTEVKNDQLTFSVKDQGMGISIKDQENLFQIFYRATNATNIPGTGLGLHIVAKYVEMMNGKIELKSELNKGTEINIIFAQ